MSLLIESICGPGSVALDKTESSRRLSGIRYNFDLDDWFIMDFTITLGYEAFCFKR